MALNTLNGWMSIKQRKQMSNIIIKIDNSQFILYYIDNRWEVGDEMHFLCEHLGIFMLLSMLLSILVFFLLLVSKTKVMFIVMFLLLILTVSFIVFICKLDNSDTYIKEVGTTYSGTVIEKVNENGKYNVTLKEKDGDKNILRIKEDTYQHISLNEQVKIVKVGNRNGIQVK